MKIKKVMSEFFKNAISEVEVRNKKFKKAIDSYEYDVRCGEAHIKKLKEYLKEVEDLNESSFK